MGRRHLLYLLYTSSARPPSSPPYFPAPPPPPPLLFHEGYRHESGEGNHTDEMIGHQRAPSTLEAFKRLKEEKASQLVARSTMEKATDGVTGDGSNDGNSPMTGDAQSTK
ncbi:hypothetical protein L1987_07465 [Smallanthus sonchifolius]|uniref:Uncharacterized protein n=1 Tax=Smallanthus sonchifolius TaxID=185202 RepID=A0ACB9K0W2_9ASTR|nr:hypothetical protein L1987_07465 [Smallanthus sonchifolius]